MTLRKRKLKIEGMSCSHCEGKIEKMLQELEGVRSANADHETGRLVLKYNVMETNLEEIEPHLEDLGYPLSSGLGSKMKIALIHDGDRTSRENYLVSQSSICRLNCCDSNQNKTFKKRQN